MFRGVLVLLLVAPTSLAQTSYTDSMYRRALDNDSTAPSYVLVALQDDVAATERVVCIPAPFLLGSIHFEYQLDFDEAGRQKALALAVAQPGRVFTFADPKARANVQARYGPDVLSQTREKLLPMSDTELREAVRKQRFNSLSSAGRDAVAHVLLERGILVGLADRTGGIYLAE